MNERMHLYLFALEVARLEVGKTYNPLPSHLTLVSRFYSHGLPDDIDDKVRSLFNETKSIRLVFDHMATIGPKLTVVHLIQQTEALKKLHGQLIVRLNEYRVDYTQPEYIGEGWMPHVSNRDDDNFSPGFSLLSKAAYLIEVHKEGENHLRSIQKRFNLSN